MMTRTTLFAKARTVALVCLALGIAAAVTFPAEAAILSGGGREPGPDKGSQDCQSRSEVRDRFIDVGLTRVEVSRTGKHHVYKVSGYKALGQVVVRPGSGEQVQIDRDGRVRFVVLYDACDESVLRQITPSIDDVGAVFE